MFLIQGNLSSLISRFYRLVASYITIARQSRYALTNIRKPRDQALPNARLDFFRLIKSFANILSKAPLSKLLRSLVAQPARDLIKLIVRDDRILLQAVFPRLRETN